MEDTCLIIYNWGKALWFQKGGGMRKIAERESLELFGPQLLFRFAVAEGK